MRRLLSFAAVMLAMAAVSCSKPEKKKEEETFKISLDVRFTDTRIWNDGDEIGIYAGIPEISNIRSVLKHGSGTSSGLFEFETSISSITGMYLCFPYDANSGTDAGKVNVLIPQQQTDGADYGIYTGKGGIDESFKGAVTLEQLTGKLQIDMVSDGIFSGSIRSITVNAPKSTGSFSTDITSDSPALDFINGNDTFTLKFNDISLSPGESGASAYAVMAPGKYDNVIITAVTDKGESVSSPVTFEIAAGQTSVTEITVTDPSVEIIDLNKNGEYANCYIAYSPDALYRFDAKVMGTGTSTPGIMAPEEISPKDVFVLWETGDTPGNIIKSVSLSDDGTVTFSLSDGADGNAVIAVTDGKAVEGDWPRSRGTVLWSWHIWARSDINDVTCTTSSGKDYTIMDCNLGDWNQKGGTDEYHGLKYQWGRKDPFVGFGSTGTVIQGSVCCSEGDYVQLPGVITSTGSDEETMREAIAFPEVFFGGTYSTSYDWYGTGDGPGHRNDFLWGYREDGNYMKTIFDPCPPGYMVAPAEVFSGFTSNGESAFSPDNFAVEGNFENGWYFTSAGSFFPAAGSMTYNNGVLRMVPSPSGREGYYWSSTPDGDNARMVDFTASYIFMNNNKRASGCSVRCVKI